MVLRCGWPTQCHLEGSHSGLPLAGGEAIADHPSEQRHAQLRRQPGKSRPRPSTEDCLERQRLAAGAKGCDNALMDCLTELADVWRQLAKASAQKRSLQSLRDGVREEAAAVRSFEEAGAAALRLQVG